MIDEIHAQHVALIEDATLIPSPKLTVITGETGAGKTALLGALKLLMGERADSSLIREGCDSLLVEGRVYLDDNPEGHIVSRSISSGGRARTYLDGHMASVSEIADLIGSSCDLCGQHAHQSLLDVSAHTALIDSFNTDVITPLKENYEQAFKALSATKKELSELTQTASTQAEVVEQEHFVLQRINEVAPLLEEYEELQEKLPIAEHAEQIMSCVYEALEALQGEDSAEELLTTSADLISRAAQSDVSLSPFEQRLSGLCIEVQDIASELASYLRRIDFDAETLAAMQERMGTYTGLLRRYGPGIRDVLLRKEKAQATLDTLEHFDERLAELKARLAEQEDTLRVVAIQLTEARKSLAPALEEQVAQVMHKLEMGSASVSFDIELLSFDQWKLSNPARIELMYKPGASMSAKPLRKIASGGEISRVMLSLKVVLGQNDKQDTIVFDEVDAGVGGATARALAEVIADLSRTHQVIVVTHLAQVAVAGNKHYVVQKSDDALPVTSLHEVRGEERAQEIARMLSGEISKSSLVHAQQLLDEASQWT